MVWHCQTVKLLLTSGGVTTPRLRAALVDMLGKPIEDAHALCIPTAQWGHPWCTPQSAFRFVTGDTSAAMTGLGWSSVGILELAALPALPRERWETWVREADVLLVDGGEATYLAHTMSQSGLDALLPTLHDTVWVGVSAGSMVLTPRIGEAFTGWEGSLTGDRALGLVDFAIYPHLDHPDMPANTLDNARAWQAEVNLPAYVLDDRSAVRVDDTGTTVISDGTWHYLE